MVDDIEVVVRGAQGVRVRSAREPSVGWDRPIGGEVAVLRGVEGNMGYPVSDAVAAFVTEVGELGYCFNRSGSRER